MNNVYAATVGLTWYDGNSTISGASSCTVGGTFVPPTPPSRTGYVFAGWELTCASKIRNLDTSIRADAYGWTRLSSSTGSNMSNYGLTPGSGEFAAEFSYGTVYGMANCNNTSGTSNTAGTPTLASSGINCWCQATGFTATASDYTSGPQCTVSPMSSLWVFNYEYSSVSSCASSCASRCGNSVNKSSSNFRIPFFSVVGQ